MGIKSEDLIAGQQHTIERLAELSGVSVAELLRATPRVVDGDAWFAGIRFPSASVGGWQVRGCLDCIDAQLGLRGIWSLPFVTICPEHNRPLVTLWTVQDKLERYDIVERWPELERTAQTRPEMRDPSPFELWFLGRLEGNDACDHWLDQFDLHASAQFCFELGRAAIATKLPKWRSLPDNQQWWPADVGYRLCSGRGEALRAALTELQHLMGQPEEGPRKIFGGLYDLLAVDPTPKALLPFREILRRQILETWPLAPGDEVLAETVLRRGRMSQRAAARLMQVPEADVLAATASDGRSPPGWTLIDTAEARTMFGHGLAEPEFQKGLSLLPHQFAQARDAGLFQPTAGGLWDAWAAQDLIDELLTGAEPIYVVMHDWRSLGEPLAGCR